MCGRKFGKGILSASAITASALGLTGCGGKHYLMLSGDPQVVEIYESPDAQSKSSHLVLSGYRVNLDEKTRNVRNVGKPETLYVALPRKEAYQAKYRLISGDVISASYNKKKNKKIS